MNGLTNGITSTPLPLTTIKPHLLPPAPEIRHRDRIATEEEAGSTLNLGDFQHVHCLSMSEARLIVLAIFEHRRQKGRKPTSTESLTKMQEYMDTYARFKSRAVTGELEGLMAQHPDLETFEKAQLTTLCPGDADEAKTLVPSLVGKIDDGTLNELLGQINGHRSTAFVEGV